ncbi:hypothetical protein H072_9657 [Dactylellina haptotyla CBS 200.50]|uniref:Peptidase A1 domain-containing protein n=1 Tax=Dactylellina haptotyla (strain CBS 200.50) TaxID=1284197 RepID=S8A248_DACHA|nr:hypothetical protein H072_9657 [Dactylellina haptotyla CBS 200.50]
MVNMHSSTILVVLGCLHAQALNTLHYEISSVDSKDLVFNDGLIYREGRSDRIGIKMEIGKPPQTVWLAPSLALSDTTVNEVSSCYRSPDKVYRELSFTDLRHASWCEFISMGLFNSRSSLSFLNTNQTAMIPPMPWTRNSSTNGLVLKGKYGKDSVNFSKASPNLNAANFTFALGTATHEIPEGIAHSTLGLGRNSTFLQTFYPKNKVFGISYPWQSRTQVPVRRDIDLDGVDLGKSEGIIYSQALPKDLSAYPFKLTVESMSVKGKELVTTPFEASIDVNLPTTLPMDVFRLLGEATGGRKPGTNDLITGDFLIYDGKIPEKIKDQWALTVRFSNGHKLRVPQQYLLLYVDQLGYSATRFTNVEQAPSLTDNLVLPGPIIGYDLLQLSYLMVDYEREQWSIAHAANSSSILGSKPRVPNQTGQVPPVASETVGGGGAEEEEDTPNGGGIGGVTVAERAVRSAVCISVLTSLVVVSWLV